MKIVYAGTPTFAVEPLRRLVESGADIAGVITQTDKPTGRSGRITFSPVKEYALSVGLPVYQFEKIRLSADDVKKIGADLMITCAYGQILSEEILSAFKWGVYNLHASLLPKYRGAAPIQAAILNGDEYTGITVMKTDIGLDTGDILLVKRLKIGEKETAGELSARLSSLAADCAKEAVKIIEDSLGSPQLMLQDDSAATLVKKIKREDAKISFSLSGEEIVNKVRALNPEPTAFALLNGSPVNIFSAEVCPLPEGMQNAHCGEVLSEKSKAGLIVKCLSGAVRLNEIQLSGGKRISGADALNGRKIRKGDCFED